MMRFRSRDTLRWAVPVVSLVICALGFTGCSGGPADEVDGNPPSPLVVRASVDRAEVASGDQVRMVLEADFEADYRVEELDLGDEIGGLEVLDRGRNVLRTVRGRTGLIDWFLLRPPTVGSYVVEPIEFVAIGPDGEAVRQSTNEVFIEVATRLEQGDEAGGLRALKPPVEPPARWPWVVGILGLIALVALWWWWRKRRRRQAPEVVLAPHELAFAELEALRNTDFTNLIELRRYYYELSAVLRRYVEGRFGLNATDLTSQEIRARLAELGLETAQERKLDRFFVATDGVKYAAQVPSEVEVEGVYEAVLSFVEETVPSESDGELESEVSAEGGPAQDVDRGDAATGNDAEQEPAPPGVPEDPDARFRP